MLKLGTRTLDTQRREHPAASACDRSLEGDPGMSKLVTASLTFVAASSKVTAANGTFAAFVAGDPILIEGANLNNGQRIVTGIDAANSAFLALDYPPKNEGPVTATVRTP